MINNFNIYVNHFYNETSTSSLVHHHFKKYFYNYINCELYNLNT